MKRNKQIAAFLLALGATFITGCGGGSGDGSSYSNAKYVFIMHRTPEGVCEQQSFRDDLENRGFENVDTAEYDYYDKTCSDYPGARKCEEDDYDGSLQGLRPADCVVWFDSFPGYSKRVESSDVSLEDITWAEKVTSAISASVE